jgi:glutathione S-transferase
MTLSSSPTPPHDLRLYHAPSSYYSMVARLALLEADVSFESQRMDIHPRKDQLTLRR